MLNISKPVVVFSATYGQACFDVICPCLVGDDYKLPEDEINYLLCLIETACVHRLDILGVMYLSHIVVFPDQTIAAMWENNNGTNIKELEDFLKDKNILSICNSPKTN